MTADGDRLLSFCAARGDAGRRLDRWAAERIPELSRSRAAQLIAQGCIRVNGAVRKANYRMRPGDAVEILIPALPPGRDLPEAIPLEILFEDDHLVVLNKSPGRVVHPAPGHFSGTLVNALLFHFPNLAGVGAERRPGIVHRLDRDTSGVLVVAKNDAAHQHLSDQFKRRSVRKTYLALVCGTPRADAGVINLPIGRHPTDRKRMSIASRRPRTAETSWRVRERLKGGALLEIDLKTGRTHQIRVHCAAMQHPVWGDPVYGGRKCGDLQPPVARQMLHAWRLQFTHPADGTSVEMEAPLSADMAAALQVLRAAR